MIEQRTAETEYLFTTNPYCRILNHIKTGEENAIHLEELIKLSGIENRELRKIIEIIRRKGVVILSDKSGYYFPSSAAEVTAYRKKEERRARSVLYTIKAARKFEQELTERGE